MILPEDTILENRYRIDDVLAQNESGATYRGFDTELSIPIIIKEKILTTPEEINRFKQEALVLAGLRHPALASILQQFGSKDRQYLVADFLAGESLGEYLRKSDQPLLPRFALQHMVTMCEVVGYLHRQNPPIFHCDINPDNVKISYSGKAVLLDVGIAKKLPSGVDDDTVPLSPYFAPEICQGKPPSTATDLYALGATLYTFLTKKLPPDSLRRDEFNPLATDPTLHPETAQAITLAMRLNPAERPVAVTEWQQSIETLIASPEALKLPARPAPVNRIQQGVDAAPADPVSKSTAPAFWLVDPAGVGYPIDTETLTIGSNPRSNIRLDYPQISPLHARIRVTGQQCQVMDEESRQGTMLNNHRLGLGWYPLEPGDILIIGVTRFHLTSTKPVKIGSTTPLPVSDPNPVLMGAESGLGPPPPGVGSTIIEPQDTDSGRRKLLNYVLIATAVLSVIGASALITTFFINSASSSSGSNGVNSAGQESPQPEGEELAASAITTDTLVTDTAKPESATSEPEAAPLQDAAPEDTPTATTTPESATATPAVTATSSPTPEEAPAVVETAASATLSATATASPATETPTAQATQVPATPTPAGPTIIPVGAEEVINQIGATEVTDIDINLRNPLEVYALVKQDGLYKSETGGSGPWKKLPVDATSVTAFVIDPTNPARLYAPTWNAVLKTADGGNTWQAYTEGLQGNQTVDLVTVDPEQPNILFAGVGEKLVVSSDGGQTWSSQSYGKGLGVSRLHSIVVDPFNHETVYVGGLAGSLYKSTDGGRNFSQLPGNIGEGAYGVAAHPTRPDVYLVGINSSDAAMLQTENGLDFSSVSEGLVYGGADSAYGPIMYAPSIPNIVYVGSGSEDNGLAKGIFKSTDGGQSWVQLNDGLPVNPDTGQPFYVKSIAVHPTDPDIVFAATGGGLYQTTDGGVSWTRR